MLKYKLFSRYSHESLEKKVNEFLEKEEIEGNHIVRVNDNVAIISGRINYLSYIWYDKDMQEKPNKPTIKE